MKAIKLTEKNADKIIKAITDNIKRTFTLEEVMEHGRAAEKKFENLGISKVNRKGSIVTIPYGDCVPNSYKWRAEEQVITLERKSTGWFLVNVSRSYVPMRSYGNGGRSKEYKISQAAVDNIMKNLSITTFSAIRSSSVMTTPPQYIIKN